MIVGASVFLYDEKTIVYISDGGFNWTDRMGGLWRNYANMYANP
jgi:hypothetical protein